jgi:hypothetical protein
MRLSEAPNHLAYLHLANLPAPPKRRERPPMKGQDDHQWLIPDPPRRFNRGNFGAR